MYRACFSADTAAKHPGFYAAFQTAFQADLDPGSASFPATLSAVTSSLRSWRNRLQAASDAGPQGRSLRVEASSSVLAAFRPHDMELPGSGDAGSLFGGGGGGAGTSSSSGGNSPWLAAVRLHSLVPDVTPLRRGGVSQRALTFLGVDGSTRRFIMSSYSSQAAGGAGRGEERMLQLLRTLNACFGAHPGTRSRPGCSFDVPACISVWPHVRLVEEDASCVTLAQVYDAHCSRNGKDPDAPFLLFKSRLDAATTAVADGAAATAATAAATAQGAAESMLDERLAAFGAVCKEQVSENILSQFAYKTMPQPHSLLAFRRAMASQLALCGLVGHAARCGGRQAQRLAFSRATGGVHQLDFGPVFAAAQAAQADGGATACPLAAPGDEPVPFRLTRNLHSFFTPFTVEGVFVPSLAAAADACTAHVAGLDAHCGLFFADLVTMAWKGGSGGDDDVTQQLLRELGKRCAADMVARISDVAPQGSSKSDGGSAAVRTAPPIAADVAAPPSGEMLATAAAAAATNAGGGAPPLHRGASGLVEQAMSPAHLCRMPLDWQPWL